MDLMAQTFHVIGEGAAYFKREYDKDTFVL